MTAPREPDGRNDRDQGCRWINDLILISYFQKTYQIILNFFSSVRSNEIKMILISNYNRFFVILHQFQK